MGDRHCGTCNECCIHLELEGRKAHQPCPHLDHSVPSATQCRIYDRRPGPCVVFMCLWRTGHLPWRMRPDRTGVIAHLAVNQVKGFGINVVECWEGAVATDPGVVDACRGMSATLVATTYYDGLEELYSKDLDWIRDFATKNPGLQIPTNAVELKTELEPDGDSVLKIRVSDEHTEGGDHAHEVET